jgi:hypothetical protein
VLALGACGSTARHTYAGLEEGEAKIAVLSRLAEDVRNRSDPLYRHELRFVSASESYDASGAEAWLIRVHDATTNGDICGFASDGPFSTQVFIRGCRESPPVPPEPPVPPASNVS